MPRRSFVLVSVLVVFVAVVASCGGDDGADTARRGSGSTPGAADAPLQGTEWVLDQEASGLTPVSREAMVTAQFGDDGNLSGSSGCNRYFTAYSVDGAKLRITGPVGGTMMACARAVMRVEQGYLARLPKAESFSIDGRVLTIETSGGGPLVYRALEPDKALTGDWVVTGYFRPGAIVSPVEGSSLTATFEAGQISGDSGCNQYSGPYEVDGSAIAIGPLASTLRACADPAIDQQASDYLAALALARTFTVDSRGLTLLRDDGGIAVTFQRA